MKSFILKLMALAFPWLVLLIKDNPGGAVVALILQATLIGWIPASIWAFQALRESEKKPPREL